MRTHYVTSGERNEKNSLITPVAIMITLFYVNMHLFLKRKSFLYIINSLEMSFLHLKQKLFRSKVKVSYNNTWTVWTERSDWLQNDKMTS